MATYPIKMLKDETNTPFVPLVGTDAIVDPEGKTLEERLKVKLGPDNLKAGEYVNVETKDYDCYISVALPSGLTLIDNLTTEESAQGSLDAHQGYVLNTRIGEVEDEIPDIVNNLTTVDTTKGLSAYQGYLLSNKFNNYTTTEDMNAKFEDYLPLTGGTLTGKVLITGTAGSQPFQVRGIVGSNADGTAVDELHLQYGANMPIKLGNTAAYSISADGGTYTGHSSKDLALTGGTLTGTLKINNGSTSGIANASGKYILRDHNNTNVTLDATGGSLFLGYQNTTSMNWFNSKVIVSNSGQINPQVNSGGTWIAMSHGSGATLYNSTTNSATSGSNASALWGIKTTSGAWSCGVLSGSDNLYFVYGSDSSYSSGSNNTANAYISSAGAFTSASLRSTKENIEQYTDSAVNKINAIDICSFNYKGDNHKSYRVGFIADETDSIFAGENHDCFDLNNSVGMLLKAIQELSTENKELKARIEKLES